MLVDWICGWRYAIRLDRLPRSNGRIRIRCVLGGVCVIVNKRHIHADSDGFFHLSIDAPVPRTVSVKAYKRYSDAFLPFEETLLLSQIEERPLVLRPKK